MRRSLGVALLLTALLAGFYESADAVCEPGLHAVVSEAGCSAGISCAESLLSPSVPPRDSIITIRLFSAARPDAVLFTPLSGSYSVNISGLDPFSLGPGEPLLLFSANGRVGVKSLHLPGVMAEGVRITPSLTSLPGAAERSEIRSRFSLAIPGDNAAPARTYTGELLCSNDDGMFLLLNETGIEDYLPGVVRTEGGTGRPQEFCKAQAVLARTYAWLNLSRHMSDGYHLCDDVHCQATYGVTDEKVIVDAVRSTAGIVVTTPDSVLAQAAYHSNCGGETASAADVWLTALPHLQSITDPWCVTTRNSVWTDSIPLRAWSDFLRQNGYTGETGSPRSVTFIQKGRLPYFEPDNGTRIAVTAIRNEFHLRSSFFSLSQSGPSIVVRGRGYGHGVGLCQEGAMVMASRGHTWREIIAFYYRNVLLIDIGEAKFPVTVK